MRRLLGDLLVLIQETEKDPRTYASQVTTIILSVGFAVTTACIT
jgi:hypothetical protein